MTHSYIYLLVADDDGNDVLRGALELILQNCWQQVLENIISTVSDTMYTSPGSLSAVLWDVVVVVFWEPLQAEIESVVFQELPNLL